MNEMKRNQRKLFTSTVSGVFLVGGLLLGGWAQAQIADPTRPPGAGAGTAAGMPAGYEDQPQGVQAVFVRPNGKSTALVNGQMLRLGDKVNDMKVIRISDRGVVLRGDSGTETLNFYPGIDKSMIKMRRATSATSPETNTLKEVR